MPKTLEEYHFASEKILEFFAQDDFTYSEAITVLLTAKDRLEVKAKNLLNAIDIQKVIES